MLILVTYKDSLSREQQYVIVYEVIHHKFANCEQLLMTTD